MRISLLGGGGVLVTLLARVAPGVKRVILGTEIYEYDASRMLVHSVDGPVKAKV